jgi:hypothetical protein
MVDRRLRYSEKDWRVSHYKFIQQWETREKMSVTAGLPHD